MHEAPDERPRCTWAGVDPLMIAYHDAEWGIPCHDDRELFERLMLEGFQAGLSWATILRKRQNFFAAFDGWRAERIATYGPVEIARLLADPGIVRNRLKVAAAVTNARAFLAVQSEFGSFGRYLCVWTDGAPRPRTGPPLAAGVPARTPLADALSADLRRRGFTFVGSTIVYAFMQSVGMVNDHQAGCYLAASLLTEADDIEAAGSAPTSARSSPTVAANSSTSQRSGGV